MSQRGVGASQVTSNIDRVEGQSFFREVEILILTEGLLGSLMKLI